MVAIQQLAHCRYDDGHGSLPNKTKMRKWDRFSERWKSILPIITWELTAIGAGQTHRRCWWFVFFARHFRYDFVPYVVCNWPINYFYLGKKRKLGMRRDWMCINLLFEIIRNYFARVRTLAMTKWTWMIDVQRKSQRKSHIFHSFINSFSLAAERCAIETNSQPDNRERSIQTKQIDKFAIIIIDSSNTMNFHATQTHSFVRILRSQQTIFHTRTPITHTFNWRRSG